MFKSLKLQHILILLISVFFVFSCEKDPPAPTPPTKPEVSFALSTITNGVDTIKDTYIFVSGIVKDTGRAPITDHGFIISTDTSALISNQSLSSSKITKFSLGPLSGAGGFSAKISGLIPNTRYSIASFATNSAGTGFATDKLANAVDIKFTTVKLLAIGDTYGGGKIAYLMQPGDTTYDANVQHGLIVSLADQAYDAKWTNADTIISCSALGVNLLQGKSNTDSIIKYNPSPKITAASIARAHRGGNYADWYLPSKNELNKLYINRFYIGVSTRGYWSSTEYAIYFAAWYQDFAGGVQVYDNKILRGSVRAIRAF